jgi:hypothetical protein
MEGCKEIYIEPANNYKQALKKKVYDFFGLMLSLMPVPVAARSKE